jgi:hypothetical protein
METELFNKLAEQLLKGEISRKQAFKQFEKVKQIPRKYRSIKISAEALAVINKD